MRDRHLVRTAATSLFLAGSPFHIGEPTVRVKAAPNTIGGLKVDKAGGISPTVRLLVAIRIDQGDPIGPVPTLSRNRATNVDRETDAVHARPTSCSSPHLKRFAAPVFRVGSVPAPRDREPAPRLAQCACKVQQLSVHVGYVDTYCT